MNRSREILFGAALLAALILAGCGPKREETPPPAALSPAAVGASFSAEAQVVDVFPPDRVECMRVLPDGSPMTIRVCGSIPASLKSNDAITVRGTVTGCRKIKNIVFVDLSDAHVTRRDPR